MSAGGLHAGTRRTNPLRHLFMPHPGTGDPEGRRLWPLQLLLQTAARSPTHGSRVAERLKLPPGAMLAAAEAAKDSASVGMWSARQYLQYLIQAVEALDASDPPFPLQLNGRDLTSGGAAAVRLSPQEAVFLRLLIDADGRPVTRRALAEAGVIHPAQLKNRLLAKLIEAGIDLRIMAGPGAYSLALPET